MQRNKVESSNILSIGWENNTMEVEFKSGDIYSYSDIPESEYKTFLNQKSKGAYLATVISKKYKSTSVFKAEKKDKEKEINKAGESKTEVKLEQVYTGTPKTMREFKWGEGLKNLFK